MNASSIIANLGAFCDKTISEDVFYSKAMHSRTKSVFKHNVLAVSPKCNNSCNSQGFITSKINSVLSQHNRIGEKSQVFAVEIKYF